jgi:anhydro-N-acetylmuramic acid kinase
MSKDSMIVAGVMSGTSADGINVAIANIRSTSQNKSHARSRPGGRDMEQEHLHHTIKLLGHAEYSYPTAVRSAILSAMNSTQASVADLARLDFLLGDLYADAVSKTQREFRLKVDLVGCHGQTLYHQGDARPFLGRRVTTTWQTGEGAVIAARVGVPVVSDFRPADMATGGKGAPLVPYLDYLWFRDSQIGRIVQNIGGIGNLTVIPAGAMANRISAFDTGPGNMVIDAVTEELFGKRFDRGGKIAATGEVLESVIRQLLRQPFFQMRPPKTAGREEFGREFVRQFLRSCGRASKQDVIATATALTARSIAGAIERFVIAGPKKNGFHEIVLSGGGARNATLVAMLAECMAPLEIVVRFSDEFGLPSDAKEATAFAVLAYETWHRRPSNVPSATGARKAAVLGKISYA